MSEEDRKENEADSSSHFNPVQFAYEQSGELTDIPPVAKDQLRKKDTRRQMDEK